MARTQSNTTDITTLQMALVGYQLERQKIEDKIREIQGLLRGKKVSLPSASVEKKLAAKPKRVLSPAARDRIASAQRKRWAEHRRKKAAAAKTGKAEKTVKAEKPAKAEKPEA